MLNIMKKLNLVELSGALCVLLLGVAVIVIARDYPMGSLSRMGTGYFPMILGALLLIIGVILVFEVARSTERVVVRIPFRPILMIGLGIITFAFLVERAGLVPATWALVVLGSLAESPFRPVTVLCIAAAMSLIGVLLFVKALGLPLSAFGG
ncbi:small permease of tripartite tricarboxylate transporter [Alcanivorax sp. S71-1-4]|uniref:tripartite tricarboxylate transporter TctB family protein n=1 Tax=Alcanivorax sp. S71-1-4 TaxID=1177159 RepID=UPI001356B48E|nr:tripartite tricarboxylate transporter TctB family protein [Alcanivorax sp. S71-1-4]KAF0810177.1 small permease of tripartite tricarboxylate transporter [Alcanivorax sp. S71-1-4]